MLGGGEHEGGGGGGAAALNGGQDAGVGIGGDHDAGVAEQVLHRVEVGARLVGQGRGIVAQVAQRGKPSQSEQRVVDHAIRKRAELRGGPHRHRGRSPVHQAALRPWWAMTYTLSAPPATPMTAAQVPRSRLRCQEASAASTAARVESGYVQWGGDGRVPAFCQ